jgi:hypothetical protein
VLIQRVKRLRVQAGDDALIQGAATINASPLIDPPMKELELIHGRFNQTFKLEYAFGSSITHRAWHGPSLMRALEGVEVEQAKTKPIGGRHSIWEVVNHCAYWMVEVGRALSGEDIFDIEEIEDWPKAGGSSEEWQTTLERLAETHEKLDQKIWVLKPESLERKLDATFGETYFGFTFRKMLHGICDHNIYHAGQISLLKRA